MRTHTILDSKMIPFATYTPSTVRFVPTASRQPTNASLVPLAPPPTCRRCQVAACQVYARRARLRSKTRTGRARAGAGLEQQMEMVSEMLYWIVQAGDPLCMLKRLAAMNVRAARRYEC
jgi:hypothetical protein